MMEGRLCKMNKGVSTMRRIIIAFVVIILLTAHVLASPQYIASALREPFHFITCAWAMKISPSNAVYYETREEAIKAGHRPCKFCKP
jgi:micrococcal nuclease